MNHRPPTGEWVLLAYRIPREPSTPRIAIWRKLRRLGAVQLLDGLVALPCDARTKEHLEWIADDVLAAGGEANLWLARPATRAQERSLAAQMSDDADAEYHALVEHAAAALDDPPGSRKRAAARLRRDLKRIHQRDHFPGDGHRRALGAIERLEKSITSEEAQT